jgi:predicted metal-dependent hydrolase
MILKYNLTRQHRKTLSLFIKDGLLNVRAPMQTTKDEIDKFVLSKERWINKHLLEESKRAEIKRNFIVAYGSKLLWRGQECPLVGEANTKRIWIDETGFHLPEGKTPDELKYNVIRLYKLYAKPYLTGRLLYFAKIMKVKPSTINITNAKTRWSSCNKMRSVNFSWRLMMAEDEVIDAVVVHELAHIKELNHSQKFYSILTSILPDYYERDLKLKDLSKRLRFENWEI